MRVFQNFRFLPAYLPSYRSLTRGVSSFAGQLEIFIRDRHLASHILKPALDGCKDTFFTLGHDERLQRAWARENGMKTSSPLEDILVAQVEAHRTEVFYNFDTLRYPSSFVTKLPGCVKRKIVWRAAPFRADSGAYDLILCNFPTLIENFEAMGWRVGYFTPAHDPEMDSYAANEYRPLDVLFVGGYSHYHKSRAAMLNEIAKLRVRFKVEYCLDKSRLTSLSDSPIGILGPLRPFRRPADIRAVSSRPVFGRQLYEKLSRAKVVINGAIDMAGTSRGNMRCWEAMGCGAAMLSDAGVYPEGMEPGVNFESYSNPTDAFVAVQRLLDEPHRARGLAIAGHKMISNLYSKQRQ